MRSQRGASILLAVIMVSVLLGFSFMYTLNYVNNSVDDLVRQRRRIEALQVMQDFALMAQRANQVFTENAGACPGANYVQLPAGRPFCWNVNGGSCIAAPASTGVQQLCMSIPNANALMRVADLRLSVPNGVLPRIQESVRNAYEFRYQFMDRIEKRLYAWLSPHPEAQAQAAYPWLPNLGGPPTLADINIPVCNAGTPGNTFCKQCQGGLPGVQNLECIELRVCLTAAGCAAGNPDEWYRQRVGLISR